MSNTAPLLPHHARVDISFADCDLIARALQRHRALRSHREMADMTPAELDRLICIESRFDALHEAAKRGGHVSDQRTYTTDEVRAWLRERAQTTARASRDMMNQCEANALLVASDDFGKEADRG
jgi:hypothetical protein